MKAAVVTGASGFIGSALSKALVKNGYTVFAVIKDRKVDVSLLQEIWNAINPIYCELAELDRLAVLLSDIPAYRENRMDFEVFVLFHLAWDGVTSRGDYALQIQNIRYACDAVATAKALGCTRFVGAGSSTEDEFHAYVPLDEATPSPSYYYSIAKYSAQMLAKTLATELQIEFCWGKVTNAYGPADPSGRFLFATLLRMLANEPCPLTTGEQIYDFIHVDEVARAFLSIGAAGHPGSCYYITSGQARKLREFISEMYRVAKSSSELRFGAVPYNGVYLAADIFDANKLARDTGFRCGIPFSSGISETIAWARAHRNIGNGS